MAVARGVSTVVDVSLALLLVSASVATLVAATPPEREQSRAGARTTAALLAATNARIDYRGGNASGTVAGLLADATANDTPDGFRSAVRRRAARTVRTVPVHGQVTARPVGGGRRIAVGNPPPPSADVDAAAFTVGRNGTPVRVVVRTWSP
ncbi:MAG: hypothetical protein ABEH77_01570 [Halobacteriaceae archaeon]